MPGAVEGRRRTTIEGITPLVDLGRYPVKRSVGDVVVVEADAFADGHDAIRVRVRHRPPGATAWSEVEMEALGNDRWRASFRADHIGSHAFGIVAWTDRCATWRRDLQKRLEAGTATDVDLRIGAELVAGAAEIARDAGAAEDARALGALARRLGADGTVAARAALALDADAGELVARYPDRRFATEAGPFSITVDPVLARFGAWYELFPRSTSPDPDRHGTFGDVIARLPYVAGMGFDVLYLPPIHPIGRTFRKGPNNVTEAAPDDPGVPWAIGAAEGGHTAVHPDLGTLDDFAALVTAAREAGLEIALDIAFQASPDHPFVLEHPTWFRQRPDGTVQYAENPPKQYQDIYPFDFESEDWRGLWSALLDVIRFWMARGVRIFRVDNPHTKALPFWEWCIAEVKRTDPDVLFLAEAFTRPKVMYGLAKLGFSQSYTYFTWRTGKQELMDYFRELSTPPVSEFFRPNVWPNTPDILHETLQHGGRPMFESRLVLAATLAATYGIYGPAYELQEHVALRPGSEEYLDSEKYQQRTWDLEDPRSLAPLITRINGIRRAHPALQANDGLRFHAVDDELAIAYTKMNADRSDVVLTVVNLDPGTARTVSVDLELWVIGLDHDAPYEAEDLLGGGTALWHGGRAEVRLDPSAGTLTGSARMWALHRRPRSERDFEAYL